MSKTLPEQCKPNCPFLKKPDFENYPIVFSRNCKGPVVGDDRGIGKKVEVSTDGVEDIQPGTGNSVGKFVCRNIGANQSLDALEEIFKNQEEQLADLT
jgi:hypothetical protein